VFNDVLSWSSGGVRGTISIVGHASLLGLVAIVVLSATALGGLIGMAIIGSMAMAIMLLIRSRVRRLSEFSRVAAARSYSFASEFLGGIKDVKLSGREPAFVRIYGDSFDTYGAAMGNLKLLQAIPPLALLFLGQSGIILIALILWKMGRSSGEIAAEMALVLLVTARVIPAVTRLAGEVGTLWNVVPNVEGVQSLMRQLPPAADRDGAPDSRADWENWRRLELDNVGYQYSSERGIAVDGVTVTVERGKSYGIAGPTGAGKTTLVDLMLGLLFPMSGSIQVDGVALNAANARAWQKKIGYVPQAPLIADDSLLANVAFGVPAGDVDEDHAVRCLKLANLAEVLESVTLHGPLGERGNRLSGGQRQRVAIARALYDKPDILVLDEATSALDTLSERAVLEALDNLHGKVTTITVAHRLSTIERCDQVLVLDRGHLVASGPYATLTRTSDLFSSMAAAAGGRSVESE
jgi:ABC-type multidrug transport system fused ATPase/permease subunit